MKEPCLLRLPVDFANQKRSNAKSLYSLFLLFDTAMRNFAMTFCLLYNMGFFIRYDTLWTVDCGLWTVDCGLWTVDCGLWTADSLLVFTLWNKVFSAVCCM